MQGGVRTLSVRLGVDRVFWLCIALLEVAYAGAVGASILLTTVSGAVYRGAWYLHLHICICICTHPPL